MCVQVYVVRTVVKQRSSAEKRKCSFSLTYGEVRVLQLEDEVRVN